MKVTTPSISWHNRERVNSIDFQPKAWPCQLSSGAMRLASAGDDHHVVIWNVDKDTDGKMIPSCIADLSRHQNSVNVVRWSHDGKLLASGDTDSAIFIWQFQDKDAPPDIFGDNALPSTSDTNEDSITPSENWTVFKTYRGHLQDVIGLEFSPCNNYLVSCSTDNTAIIFDVSKGSKVKILSEHKGWVNGVSWDPRNEHVFSIASDRVLRCFKTKSFKLVSKTNKCKLSIPTENWTTGEERNVRLFHDDTFQSFYRRLSYSPDGELLVVPSGVLDIDGETTTEQCTYIFSRMDYSRPVLYLPHKEFSVAVRFSPIKYKLRNAPNGKRNSNDVSGNPLESTKSLFALPYRMVYALATKNTICFYDTQQLEPFACVSQIHYIGLNDLTWSSDGRICMVSSSDGFCSLISFNEEEIGERYTEEEETKENLNQPPGDDAGNEEMLPIEVNKKNPPDQKNQKKDDAQFIAVRR